MQGERNSGLEINEKMQPFTTALDNRMEMSRFKIEECKTMSSKKVPLWITCANSEDGAEDIQIMFKVGDDLRQDKMTLQIVRIMDKIWLDNGLDLRMSPYQVVATKDQEGMIEIVQNSTTTEYI